MKSKNVKVVDQNNIDRDANVMFALDLEGSEYVVYWIERDDDENNVFVSKVLKNTDGTSNLLDIENVDEKNKVSEIVKLLIAKSVKDENDKLSGDVLTLDDGKVVRFVSVSFNKEQRFNIQKTYITTVKKEVTRVSEKYYDVVKPVEIPKTVEEIFPTVSPLVPEMKEAIFPDKNVVEPVESVPAVESSNVSVNDSFVAFGAESTIPSANEPVVEPTIVEPITSSNLSNNIDAFNLENTNVLPVTPEVAPVSTPVAEVVDTKVVEPTVVVPTPVSQSTESVNSVSEASQPLVFNASKETNLNAALGEVAKEATIPVENIEPVREFGVDEPVKLETPVAVAPTVESVSYNGVPGTSTATSPKSGFANSKFFMVVAIAFFLASCVFLGYEVFNYFQLTK